MSTAEVVNIPSSCHGIIIHAEHSINMHYPYVVRALALVLNLDIRSVYSSYKRMDDDTKAAYYAQPHIRNAMAWIAQRDLELAGFGAGGSY